ncbi:uncharacterized protein DSM5745_00749 [Aspergillus mulundensis]|uniref:Uncharacterized protein n=1 Tax=Aspergillus mulundensis TaxID=1810919 RepID=A0A3D8T4E0_9EURO|nr:hypothetical protein DSM5745_00749 [Aspergillus mulundensis]RDW93427.1 hypothetical protein DSM5745_00749 [Aspergillus mulundensis]
MDLSQGSKWSFDEVQKLQQLREENPELSERCFAKKVEDDFPGRSAGAIRGKVRKMKDNLNPSDIKEILSVPETRLLAVVIRKRRSSSPSTQTEGPDSGSKRHCSQDLGSRSPSFEQGQPWQPSTPLPRTSPNIEPQPFSPRILHFECDVPHPATPSPVTRYGFLSSIDQHAPCSSSTYNDGGDIDFDRSVRLLRRPYQRVQSPSPRSRLTGNTDTSGSEDDSDSGPHRSFGPVYYSSSSEGVPSLDDRHVTEDPVPSEVEVNYNRGNDPDHQNQLVEVENDPGPRNAPSSDKDDNIPRDTNFSNPEPIDSPPSSNPPSHVTPSRTLRTTAYVDISQPVDMSDFASRRTEASVAGELRGSVFQGHATRNDNLQANEPGKIPPQEDIGLLTTRKGRAELAKELEAERQAKLVLEQKVLSLERELQRAISAQEESEARLEVAESNLRITMMKESSVSEQLKQLHKCMKNHEAESKAICELVAHMASL